MSLFSCWEINSVASADSVSVDSCRSRITMATLGTVIKLPEIVPKNQLYFPVALPEPLFSLTESPFFAGATEGNLAGLNPSNHANNSFGSR